MGRGLYMSKRNDRFSSVLSKIYVAVPYSRLVGEFFDTALAMRANLELGLYSDALDWFSLDDFKEMANKLKGNGIRTNFHAAFQDLYPGSTDSQYPERLARPHTSSAGPVPPVFPRNRWYAIMASIH